MVVMTEFMGLPVHPLMVHLPVVVVPALILSVLLYIFIPPFRRRIGWLVAVLTVLASAATVGGWYTGHQFYDQHVDMIAAAGADTSVFENLLADHLYYGDILVWLVPAMAPLIWLFAALDRGRRAAIDRGADAPPAADGDAPPPAPDDPAAKGRRVVMVVLAIMILGLSGAAGYVGFKAGHSGAEAVWSTPDH